MRHASVPFNLIHVGDVIDRPTRGGSDSLAVVTYVGEQKDGDEINQLILSVGVDGERHRLEWRPCPDTAANMLARVGEGCVPSVAGLHDFLASNQLSLPRLS